MTRGSGGLAPHFPVRPSPATTARRPDLRRRGSVSLQRLQALLNSLSGFFSPFRRRTCSLSVSPSYLALDDIHHPIRVALSSNPTPGRTSGVGARRWGTGYGAFALPGAGLPAGFGPPACPRTNVLRLQFAVPSRDGPRFSDWAVSASLAATGDVPFGFFSSGYQYA